MDHSTVRSALALAVGADLPVLLWGPPGTGKSATVRGLGRELGLPVEVVVGSVREPADFSGLPIIHGGGTRFAPPRWAERLAEAGSGLLFLDELTTAPPAVQAAMLRVVLERTVGDLVLPEGVRIVAAANPPGLAADGWELSAPLANRLVHLGWEVTAEEISRGFVHGFDTAVGLQARSAPPSPPAPTRVAEARAAVGSFLRVRPELVLDVPDSPERAGRAWPSPRTWEMAAMALASGGSTTSNSPDAAVAALVVGAVGEAEGFELLSWLRALDLPSPEKLLADPGQPLPDRVDRLHALLGALSAHVTADGSPAVWERSWEVVARVARTAPDVAADTARTLAARRPDGAVPPTALLELVPVLRATGLMS